MSVDEMDEALRNLFPLSIYNNLYSQSLINQFSQYFIYPNEKGIPYISIDKISIFNSYFTMIKYIKCLSLNSQE